MHMQDIDMHRTVTDKRMDAGIEVMTTTIDEVDRKDAVAKASELYAVASDRFWSLLVRGDRFVNAKRQAVESQGTTASELEYIRTCAVAIKLFCQEVDDAFTTGVVADLERLLSKCTCEDCTGSKAGDE